jgi:hypothetical protein
MPLPDLPTAPPKQVALFIGLELALLAVIVGLPAGLTWRFTHDGDWTAMAGAAGLVVGFVLGAVVMVIQELIRAKQGSVSPSRGAGVR